MTICDFRIIYNEISRKTNTKKERMLNMRKRILSVVICLVIVFTTVVPAMAANNNYVDENAYYTRRASNLRAGPSTSSEILGVIPAGTLLDTYQRGDWLHVTDGTRSGYISKSLCVRAVSVAEVAATSGLNLRTSPNTSSSVKATLPYGTLLDCSIGTSGVEGWTYVEVISGSYVSYRGYVSTAYIRSARQGLHQ